MSVLHHYWLRFRITLSDPLTPPGIKPGVGVTAFSRDDALQLVRERVFAGAPLPAIDDEIDDVAIADLDADHVLPYLADYLPRGIWFPRGYD